jgi:hypothetical protein
MEHGGEVITDTAETVTNCVVPVLSKYRTRTSHRKFIICAKNIYFRKKLQKCLLGSAVYDLHDCLNSMFLGGILLELSFNQFLWALCVAV